MSFERRTAPVAVYKARFPVTHRWLGFGEAGLTIDSDAGRFSATLLVDGTRIDEGPALTVLNGHFCAGRGLILTAVASM
ncbi:hypothetical protein ACLQ26_25775 [Micromonospora sp. DT43]|uniref:hypothetical protein n=1 Tax=Micromonospora sp. DT43 TaxID=3393440 RepID=UPI003CFABE1B